MTDRDKEKLFLVMAADLAQRRLDRGLTLNYPEAIALISAEIMERARDGRSVSDLMSYGQQILSADQVMDGVAEMIDEVQVEATFPDGTKLVTIHHPIPPKTSDTSDIRATRIPGEFLLGEADIGLNEDSTAIEVEVVNLGDRPIQVGSHFHFAEANSALSFNRESALNCRLDIPSGTAVRFEPNQLKTVRLIEFSGSLGMDRSLHGEK